MARPHPYQDRYVVIVIALPVTSRKAVHLHAGHPPPTTPPTQSPLSTTTTFFSFALLDGPFPVRRASSHPYRPAESLLASLPASVDAPKSP
jgi:hypothetical protein